MVYSECYRKECGGVIPMTIMDMSFRECVQQLIRLGSNKIVLENGTRIYIHEVLGVNRENRNRIGILNLNRYKWNTDGSIRAVKKCFVTIEESKLRTKTKGLDTLKQKKYWLYNPSWNEDNFFHWNDYLIPEKDINAFINLNGGINTYETISVISYMKSDIEEIDRMIWDDEY